MSEPASPPGNSKRWLTRITSEYLELHDEYHPPRMDLIWSVCSNNYISIICPPLLSSPVPILGKHDFHFSAIP
jgi:hypothetical protein